MKEDESMESRIQQAMRSRVQHFRESSDSFTFEGVRRLLEKDMGLDTFGLDSHKRFIKKTLEKYLSGTEEDDEAKDPENAKEKDVAAKEEKEEDVAKEEKEEDAAKEEKEDAAKEDEEEAIETEDDIKDKIPTEKMIKKAIWNKATYFRSKSEELTLAGVRRLLEEDLELKKFSLDSFKKLISKQLDEVLNSESNKDADSSSSSHSGSDNMKPEKVKPKKKLAQKENIKKSEGPKKRKKPAQEAEWPRKKKIMRTEEPSVENNDADHSSDELSAGASAKKEMAAPTTVYGKKVERLKSIIKACGMTVAPTVYKKAKQVPEDKREAFLIKELQAVLSKEGLSANPSEKEIKDVKRRKDRAKELEGIDTSNIVQGSRRRSSTWPPPKPPKEEPGESDGDDDSGDGDDDDSENEDGSADQGEDEEDVHATQSGDEAHEETFDSD